jgi:hypothetical protein
LFYRIVCSAQGLPGKYFALLHIRELVELLGSYKRGYYGHPEWRTFFAVIYTTDTLLHQKKLEEEFRGVKADVNWTPIIVVGKGGRGAKTAKAK